MIHIFKQPYLYLMGLMVSMNLFWISACSQTPLEKLSSDHLDTDLNTAYWSKEQDNQTSLWKNAVSYCKQNTEKPNCGAVMQLYIITNGSTQAPAIGHSGQQIHLPE